MVDLGIYGYFHFFEDIKEFIKVFHYIAKSDYFISFGKYIILHDQISTKDGRVFGKKSRDTYAFTSVYSEQVVFDKIIKEGIIAKENCINSMDIIRNQFDQYNNIKNATTFDDYGEFIDYIYEQGLDTSNALVEEYRSFYFKFKRGYFHFFDDVEECLNAAELLGKYEAIEINKYIVLHDQVSTRDGKVFGKKGKDTFVFNSVFSDDSEFEKVLKEGIIAKENCVKLEDFSYDEFDKGYFRSATTFSKYKEFMEYIKERGLN
jgi:hypothetical protein